ncbi:MAG: hypothetical protein IIU47_09280 [Lachnospiraceae bacterium]|nr:hypothetical protein [Lachnospiraceae bacterium]
MKQGIFSEGIPFDFLSRHRKSLMGHAILFLSFIKDGFQLFRYVLCIMISCMIFPCVYEIQDLDERPLAGRLRLVPVTTSAILRQKGWDGSFS